MYAVISDRGRQSHVRVGDEIACDLNSAWNEGDEVSFDRVLLVVDEGQTKVGAPVIEGAQVQGTVLGDFKGKKEVVFRFKRRKNVRVKNGHRQGYTRVRITGIDH